MPVKYDAASKIQDLMQFGEFGDVNPSITDSATFTFMQAKTMTETFDGVSEGCFLYSRHWNPSNKFLSEAISALEATEESWVTASGMSAITSTIFQLCNSGDHIVSSLTTYGGTFAFLKNYLPKFNISVTFVDITDIKAVEAAIKSETKLIYTESLTNPLLQVSDIPALASIANKYQIKLVVDNSFSPMILTPALHGAHIVVNSLTKFINGKNDCIAGAISGSSDIIESFCNVNNGTAMLLGPVLDPLRSANILKNLHTLHIRMKKHGANALYLAEKIEKLGVKVIYPGLKSHPGHETMKDLMNKEYGFGGMMAIDMYEVDFANSLMERMETAGVGYLAVSLGYFKTLFSNPGKSTSSEVPEDLQKIMGLSPGLIRMSIGLDEDIERTFRKIKKCLKLEKII